MKTHIVGTTRKNDPAGTSSVDEIFRHADDNRYGSKFAFAGQFDDHLIGDYEKDEFFDQSDHTVLGGVFSPDARLKFFCSIRDSSLYMSEVCVGVLLMITLVIVFAGLIGFLKSSCYIGDAIAFSRRRYFEGTRKLSAYVVFWR